MALYPQIPLFLSPVPTFPLPQHQLLSLPRLQRLHPLDFLRKLCLPHAPPRHSPHPIELAMVSPPVSLSHISSCPLSIPVIRAPRELPNLLQHQSSLPLSRQLLRRRRLLRTIYSPSTSTLHPHRRHLMLMDPVRLLVKTSSKIFYLCFLRPLLSNSFSSHSSRRPSVPSPLHLPRKRRHGVSLKLLSHQVVQ